MAGIEMRTFKTRLKKLEAKSRPPRLQLRQLEYPVDATGSPIGDFWARVVLRGYPLNRNELRAQIGPLVDMLAPFLILIPRWESQEAWETAAARQQVELQALARSRSNVPTTTAPAKDMVGNRFED